MVKPKPTTQKKKATLQNKKSGPKGRRKNAPGVGGSSETPPRAFNVCWASFGLLTVSPRQMRIGSVDAKPVTAWTGFAFTFRLDLLRARGRLPFPPPREG